MTKISVQIIEENATEAIKLQQFLEAYNYKVVSIAHNLKDALGFFYTLNPDVVITNIFLEGSPKGITFANKINGNPTNRKPFIFVTEVVEDAIFKKAIRTAPSGYLLKPYTKPELHYAIELAHEKFIKEVGVMSDGSSFFTIKDRLFFIKKKNRFVKVPMHTIIHIEVTGKYLHIYTLNDNFLVQFSLNEILQKLPKDQFIRIRRNTIVNISKVASIDTDDNQVVLENNKRVLISRRNKQYILDAFYVLK